MHPFACSPCGHDQPKPDHLTAAQCVAACQPQGTHWHGPGSHGMRTEPDDRRPGLTLPAMGQALAQRTVQRLLQGAAP